MVAFRPLLGLVVILLLAAIPPSATAHPPCRLPEYTVAYSAPVWSARILRSWIPDTLVWYATPNGTFGPVPFQDRVGQDEPRAVFDRDEDGRLTANDTILLWDAEGRSPTVELGLGPTAEQVESFFVYLEDGYVLRCSGSDAPTWEVQCAIMVGVGVTLLVLILLARRRRNRRMPF